MYKQWFAAALATLLLPSLAACAAPAGAQEDGVRTLILSNESIRLDGEPLSPEGDGAVTVSRDIVYYRDGTDASYGEGTGADLHSAQEADAHTVVTIRRPGTYRVSGALDPGQLAVDLGDGAKGDPEAVVTLILDGVDLTCTVAPAVIFYNVYECDTAWVAYDEEESAAYSSSPIVDTAAAGANVVLADGSVNQVNGSYVARIYKEGTTKKLHKYAGAFYSKMSMNIGGEGEGSGVLSITAENEGLDSELHLTINGGTIRIQAQNDGINTNEDGVSVTTINGGVLEINAGLGAEGDGIDSNGHIVFNGGTVYTIANEQSPDGGIDADGEILIHGGQLIAAGVRNDSVSSGSEQLYMELSFASPLAAGSLVELEGTGLSFTTEKSTQSIVFSSPELETDHAYILKVNGTVQQYTNNTAGFGAGPHGGQPPQIPEGQGEPPEPPDQQAPPELPGQQTPPEPPEGQPGPHQPPEEEEPRSEFILTDTARSFGGITDQT